MKTKQLGSKTVIILTIFFLLTGYLSASAQAVFNANNANVSFLAANKTHKVGTNGSGVGNVTLYTNVITIAGQSIDCIIRTVSLTNGSFALPAGAPGGTIAFDYSSPTGSGLSDNLDRFFSPMLTFNNGGGSAKFKFEFILGNSYNNATHKGTPVIIQNITLNTYDIDGNGGTSSNQYNEFGGFSSVTLSATPATKVSYSYNTASGLTKFRSNVNANSTIATASEHRVMVQYDEVSTFEIMVGADGSNAAYFMLDFGTGPNWAGPVTNYGTPTLDLNPGQPGFSQTSSSCGAVVRPITNGSTSLSLTGSSNTVSEVILSYDPSTILDGAFENIFPNGSSNPAADSIKLNFTTSSTSTFTLNGVVFTVSRAVITGTNYIRFSRNGTVMTTAQAEMLLDALMYANTATPPSLSYRELFIAVRETSFTTPLASFIINEICILPMEWIDFQVKSTTTSNQVQLNWKIVENRAHKGYFIEYSYNGNTWEDLGYVTGNGRTDGEATYSYTMGKVFSGTVFFRVKQLELNGSANYSTVKKVNLNSSIDLKVWPNPATDLIQINTGNKTGKASIIDASGRAVKSIVLSAGINRISVNDLNRGLYMVTFNSNQGEIVHARFLKQ
ncbi:MAG: hypothetical protein RLZZ520_1293 [Bacteroidota bacterium]|jgi:hypothetical protein